MLNQTQRDTFRLALSALNQNAKTVEELDADDICSDEAVAETRETIEDFFNARGSRLTRFGTKPETPLEKKQTIVGTLWVWTNQQSRIGARRGDLYVMDFGDARAAYFSGEA